MIMNVNVAIVGDEGAGKTSLVLAASQRNVRPGEPVPTLPPTTFKVKLPNADCKCICHDSTSRNMEEVNSIVRQCDVVLLCFNMGASKTLRSAISTWLPHISNVDQEVPIVVVGCKEDQAIVTEGEIAQLDATVNQAVVRYDKCSALNPESTALVFQHACDACVNPVLPLYHHVRERLRCKAIRAFNRIFDIVDEDNDGALSDQELDRFHVFAFGRHPRAVELNGTKQALMERDAESVTTMGVTRSGFMQLQAMMIQQQRLDICWTMLRSFGYNRQLHLKPELFEDIPDSTSKSGMVCMLSATAVSFLTAQFRRRCSSSHLLSLDLLLEDTGPASLFHASPPAANGVGHPLGRSTIRQLLVRSADPRYLPLESFLSIWAHCTFVDARASVISLLYLGFPDCYGRSRQELGSTAAEALLVRAPRRKPHSLQPVPRPFAVGIRYFNCLLFGSKGCGKTRLLQLLAGCSDDSMSQTPHVTGGQKGARLIPGRAGEPDTLLVLSEIPASVADDLSMSAARNPEKQERLMDCDAMLFGFDSVSADSYAQAKALLVSISDATNNAIPVALVGLKADLGVSSNITSMASSDCSELNVQLLRGLSVQAGAPSTDDEVQARATAWAADIVGLSLRVAENIAVTPALAAKRTRSESMWRAAKYAGAAAAGVAGLVIAYQVYSHMSLQQSISAPSRGSSSSMQQQGRAPPRR